MFFKFKSGSLSAALISVAFVLFSVPAFAIGGEDPVGNSLNWLIQLIYGPVGIGICTLAVVGVGLLCLGHYLEWKRLIQTVIGVAIVFGSGAIVTLIQSAVK